MDTDTPVVLGIDVAFLALDMPPGYREAWSRVAMAFEDDPAWAAWLGEHQRFPEEGHYLAIDDVGTEKVRVRRRTKEVSLTVPAVRLRQAYLDGRLDQEYVALVVQILTIWAERKGIPGQPAAPAL